MNGLKIEKQFESRKTETYLIYGLSVQEMNELLTPNGGKWEDSFERILNYHGCDGTAWRRKGLYGIKHFGGHLIVMVEK